MHVKNYTKKSFSDCVYSVYRQGFIAKEDLVCHSTPALAPTLSIKKIPLFRSDLFILKKFYSTASQISCAGYSKNRDSSTPFLSDEAVFSKMQRVKKNTVTRVLQLSHTNAFFFTGTTHKRLTKEQMRRHFEYFIKRLREQTGREIPFIYTIEEKNKRGKTHVHVHAVIGNIPRKLHRTMPVFSEKIKKRQHKAYGVSEIWSLWSQHGFYRQGKFFETSSGTVTERGTDYVTCYRIPRGNIFSSLAVARYIAKYLTKENTKKRGSQPVRFSKKTFPRVEIISSEELPHYLSLCETAPPNTHVYSFSVKWNDNHSFCLSLCVFLFGLGVAKSSSGATPRKKSHFLSTIPSSVP